ncbi:hypothetical protein RCL_jg21533.t1 [Rhizophagus clarus]|uniref:Uncharacterized protein n=1 Tax=Rhizophagus clarus TaxID=94130 RepID=A0A8H3QGA3_9GLOM|nr:hypothetical protein RCL_jg21533.t1 [Rhizophagus clarus]
MSKTTFCHKIAYFMPYNKLDYLADHTCKHQDIRWIGKSNILSYQIANLGKFLRINLSSQESLKIARFGYLDNDNKSAGINIKHLCSFLCLNLYINVVTIAKDAAASKKQRPMSVRNEVDEC